MNPALYLVSIFLIIFSTVNLFGIRPDLFVRQLLLITLGIILFIILRPFRIHFVRRNSLLFYIVSVTILIITYIWGVEVKGSTRWIDLWLFRFQPSELVKVCYIIYIAELFAHYRHYQSSVLLFVKTTVSGLVPFVCIALQPDLGSALVLLAITLVLLIFAPIPKKYLMISLTIALLFAPFGWFALHDYQKERITHFVASVQDVDNASYNMTQAIIAIGSGQVSGKGLGMGKQSTLAFLPEYHTDFAFSSLIEQFGLIGGIILLGIYSVLLGVFFIKIARGLHNPDELGKYKMYYLIGLATFFSVQIIINIGMNLGMLPITGITLPFISYGGSSLLMFMVALALIP